MNDQLPDEKPEALVFKYKLDASPQKLWRALTIPEFRARWLPDLAESEPEEEATIPEKQISYKMREKVPPFLETQVTFRIAGNDDGTAMLIIIHQLTDARLRQQRDAANSNHVPMMMAA